ncbi:hypothetical protein GYB29_06495 [bacterium]|nr:hypothetical protein [bacterium]
MRKAFIFIFFISFSSIDVTAEVKEICDTIYERCIDSNPHSGWFGSKKSIAYKKACKNSRTACFIYAE